MGAGDAALWVLQRKTDNLNLMFRTYMKSWMCCHIAVILAFLEQNVR